MTADDAEVQSTWKDLGTVVTELRRMQQGALADRLVGCVRHASTSGEIYDASAPRWPSTASCAKSSAASAPQPGIA